MKVLDHFSIPYKGLKNGAHRFVFEVDDAFFAAFENSYVAGGKIAAELEFDKRPDLAIATFGVQGKVRVSCDRCLQEFDKEVEGDFTLHVKTGLPDPDQDEVMFIDPETSVINFGTYLYESISLLLPMSIVHDNIGDCDPDIVSKMSGRADDEEKKMGNIWDSLKGLDFD